MKLRTWSDPKANQILTLAIIPSGLILLNLILKLIFIGHRDLALDEPFTVFYAQAGFGSLFEMLKTENNPPLHFLLMHFWIKLFGISPVSVRILSALFSVATAWFIYSIGREHFSLRTGIIASLIFTFSNYQMQFAHEARVYSLFCLLTVLSMFFFLKLSRNPGNKGLITGYWITLILLAYSHFFGWIVIFIQILAGLVIRKYRPVMMRPVLAGTLVTILFYLPYIYIFFSRFTTTVSHGTWVPAPVFSDLYTMAWRFSNAPVTTVCFLVVLLAAFVIFLFRKEKICDIRPATGLLLIWFFVPYLSMFLVSFILPVFLDRYMVFVAPAFYFLVAFSVDYFAVKRWLFYPVSAGVVLAIAITFTADPDNQRDIREAVLKTRELKKPSTLVFICPQWLDKGFTYYYDQDIFKDYDHFGSRLRSENIFPLNSVKQIDTVLLKNAQDVLYFEEWSSLVDKEKTIEKLFPAYFRSKETFHFRENFNLTRYFNP